MDTILVHLDAAVAQGFNKMKISDRYKAKLQAFKQKQRENGLDSTIRQKMFILREMLEYRTLGQEVHEFDMLRKCQHSQPNDKITEHQMEAWLTRWDRAVTECITVLPTEQQLHGLFYEQTREWHSMDSLRAG